ncbi:MAG TPA: FAD-dependent oxidoreductase, partial [Candidatus Solibacter sp.]|nr:FAD-dependent oxidoreductase [Candidatus Solibacter sp.]
MEKADYDLIVVGAGPAGSACAITAARAGAKVLLLEKDRLPRHKVCGEFVSPESLRLLASLVGEERFASNPKISSARIFYGAKLISLPIEPPAQSIARFDL